MSVIEILNQFMIHWISSIMYIGPLQLAIEIVLFVLWL